MRRHEAYPHWLRWLSTQCASRPAFWRGRGGIALLGNMAAETIDFKAYSCDSNGSNAAALKSATQLAANAAANDNTQVAIGVRAEDMQASGKQYVKFGLVTGGATGGPSAVLALGVDAKFQPASAANLASVQQLKN